MSGMAEVLAAHQLNVSTDNGDAWSPPEEHATCSCGAEIGGWVATGADWEWPDGWGKEHAAHQADMLSAAGFWDVREATGRVGKRYAELYQLLRDELQAAALEEAANWLDSAEQAQNIAFDGPSDLGILSAKYDAAIEEPAEWLRASAAAVRGEG